MSNLSLYTVNALILLDSSGERIISKYYSPPYPSTDAPANPYATLKEQREFEKSVFDKCGKGQADILLLPPSTLVLTKPTSSGDFTFHLIAPATSSNELMLLSALNGLVDAVGMLLRNQVEKRSVLDNLDLVLLAMDETIDDGIILETDSLAIASRVSRPKADSAGEIVINEQTILNAYSTIKDRLGKSIAQF